jgi:hypothetical protein
MVRLVLPLLLCGLLPLEAAAQSLADVARAEAERRKNVTAPGKVYSNDQLKPDPFAQRQTSEEPAAASAEGAPPPPPTADDAPEGTAAPARDQAYWRQRITAARNDLQRSRMFAEALQSRINALTTDFINRDDPAQRARIAEERDKAIDELERVNGEIQAQTRAIAEIEEEARREGVPPGWLRGAS